VAERDSFLLRVDPTVLRALRQWADDDLRSLNGQIEFLLRRALVDGGRMHTGADKPAPRPPRAPRRGGQG
jgi:hypothetical protein